MADRRFNMGRQGEQFLDPNSFKAFNRIKYIGNGLEPPVQERQAPIPDYSLWIDRNTGTDVLKAYHQNSKIWKPMFEGYYHPANLKEQPMNPTEGQVFIDNNGTIRYYEDNQWKVASATIVSDIPNIGAGLSYFLLMPNMYPVTGSERNYLVPHIKTGRLFDNKKYIPSTDYKGAEVSVVYPKTEGKKPNEKVSWVHVNPTYLYNSRKRFIKIIDAIKKNDYIINVPTVNTEFYGFKKGKCYGTLMRYIQDYENESFSSETTDTVSDYRRVSGGIQLLNKGVPGTTYDYIYAITYSFDTVDNDKWGNVLTGNVTIGENNEVFVGQIRGVPLVFLNGTYLEQADYTYSSTEGMLSFSGATITNEMDLVVAAFADVVRNTDPKYSNLEWMDKPIFEVTATNSNIQYVNEEKGYVLTIQHEYLKQAAKFKHPIVFVQGIAGLYDPEYGFNDEVVIDGKTGTVTVYNFGPIADGEEVKILAADIGDAKLSSGTITKDFKIKHKGIDNGEKYIVFVNGICTSPTDHEVYEDHLTIAELDEESCVGMRYELMSLNKGDTGIDLLFDSQVSNFTFQIQDGNANAVYNDCDMVVSYVYGNNTVNGVLIDKNHIQTAISDDRSYSTGEILLVKDDEDESTYSYVYKIFNTDGTLTWKTITNQTDLQNIEAMITQFNSDGSISLISNDDLKGKKLAYYAYTYANEMDEVITSGRNNECKIAFEGHQKDASIPNTQEFYVSRTQVYTPPGKGILGTYVNGIQIDSTDDPSVLCKFSIDTPISINFKKTWGNKCDLYALLKEIDDDTSMVELTNMKKGPFKNELKDYSISQGLLDGLKSLSKIIKESEEGNELYYFIEKIEAGETISVNRDWLTHGNRYTAFDNTYNANSYFGPGAIDVYLNGVMLDRSSYSLFDNNNIILNDLSVAGGSDEYDTSDPKTHSLIKYYVTEYDPVTDKTTGKVVHFNCTSPDEVLIEYRPDTTVRKIAYDIKESTYDSNGVLAYVDYEFPNSLLKTKDVIKIWIDGILYTGGYHIEGKDIVLEDSPLRMDPIKQYFDSHPDTYRAWKIKNGEYSYRKSRIIFEWR